MLENYLHHHVGCQCLVGRSSKPVKLTGVSYDDTTKKWWAYFENTEMGYAPYRHVKPLLRSIADMQREELIRYFNLPDNIEILRVNQNETLCEWEFRRVHPDSRFNNDDGFSYSAVGMSKVNPSCDAEKVVYLFSKDFDVLGLIKKGFAINRREYEINKLYNATNKKNIVSDRPAR